MKKKFLFTVLMMFITSIGISQVHYLGVQSGLNISNISQEKILWDTYNKLGFIGGIKYELLISEKYSIGADILYSQQGFTDEIEFSDDSGNRIEVAEYKHFFDYLSLPIKVGYSFGEKLILAPKIGIQPSFFILHKITSENDKDEWADQMKRNDVSNFDLAGLLELEIGYKVNSNVHLFTSFFSRYGFSSFLDTSIEVLDFRHRDLAISIGMKYRLVNEN